MEVIKRSHPRPIRIMRDINPYAQGSVLCEFGLTKVHITAVVQEEIPPFLKGKGEGWITAEYAMLPMATGTRNFRDRKGISGRTQEIQRLIGRSLRSIVDKKLLGERTIMVDCDVLVADGGTRTTSITGGFVALGLACQKLVESGLIAASPIREPLAAISVGLTKNHEIIADLNYIEDSSCESDMTLVMTESGKIVEIQGTAEGEPFEEKYLKAMVECGKLALQDIFAAQRKALGL